MEVIIAAISLGLLGSFHCIGMCGPIALALPVHQYSFQKNLHPNLRTPINQFDYFQVDQFLLLFLTAVMQFLETTF